MTSGTESVKRMRARWATSSSSEGESSPVADARRAAAIGAAAGRERAGTLQLRGDSDEGGRKEEHAKPCHGHPLHPASGRATKDARHICIASVIREPRDKRPIDNSQSATLDGHESDREDLEIPGS